MKRVLIGVALGALTLSAAQAQSTPPAPGGSSPPATQAAPPSTSTPSSSASSGSTSGEMHTIATQSRDQWLASKFKGTDVMGPDNKKIGDVSDILFDKDGKIEAYVVSVGGFLGMGAKDVALAPSSFEVIPGNDKSSDKLKLSMTKDQLKQAQNFEPYKEKSTTTGSATGSMSRPAGGGAMGGKPMSPSTGK
jgi:sporulation protein YlmC with PRC-barrel domain